MTLVIPPGFGQAAMELRNAGDPDPWFVTFGVDLSAADGDFMEAADQIGTDFGVFIVANMRSDTSLVASHLTVGSDGGEHLIVIAPKAVPGSQGAEMLPQNCACLVHKQTARAGRRGRGRMFVPNMLREGQVNNVGVLDSGAVTAFQTQFSEFLTALGSDSDLTTMALPMVLLHGTLGAGSTDPDPVTALRVDNVISTQRRRLR